MAARDPSDATIAGPSRLELFGGTLRHSESGRSRRIERAPIIVGRAEACDFHLDDRRASKSHCELAATERGVRVRDLGSSNGTFVNDIQITEAFLTRNTRLRVGATDLEFTPFGVPMAHPLVPSFGRFVSKSPRMQAIFGQLVQLAATSVNVLLLGESGVGKGYLAQLIHEQSKRASRPFKKIDLSVLDEAQTANTLFGHEKGSFTGADRATVSPFVECNGGTIFLDEIGDLTAEQQKRLLRVIDEKIVVAIGGTREHRVDVRIVTATKHNLQEMVNAKRFRDDLYYRLGTRIELPPLNDRREDIDVLTKQMLSDRGRPDLYKTIGDDTKRWMRTYHWEGNLRGLRQVIDTAMDLLGDRSGSLDLERAALVSRSTDAPHAPRIHAPDGAEGALAALTMDGSSVEAVETAARRILLTKLHDECGGVVSEIARRARVTRNFARKELARMGIVTPESRRKGGGRGGSRP